MPSSTVCQATIASSTTVLFLAFSCLLSVASSSPTEPLVASPYAPRVVTCPSEPLVRPATGLSSPEISYIFTRKQKAAANLVKWLSSVDKNLTVDAKNAPTVALTTSGGGYRSMLLGGGMVKAFDSRESKSPTAGLYQSLLYHAGLSGGSWLLSSIFGNDDGFARITDISKSLWEPALLANVLYPTHQPSNEQLEAIKADFRAKEAAGFPPTTAEAWGRLLAWQLLAGNDGGVSKTMSAIKQSEAFTDFEVPVPIITALGVENIQGDVCDAADNAITYEFSPFEFGSWDKGVQAFTPMRYLGSRPGNGTCVKGFDNLGFILGTSSSKFNEGCGTTILSVIGDALDPILTAAHAKTRRDQFAPYPNPFKGNPSSPQVAAADELYLADGGQALQNNPIWPFIQSTRAIDVLIVNDNSADTDDNWPNGTEILRTYTRSVEAGLTRMPPIPPVDFFVKRGYNKKATFFGCGLKDKLTIIYLPNVGYNGTESNVPSATFDYEAKDVQKMIANGGSIATQGGDAQWPKCLACAIMDKKRTGAPSAECAQCMTTYCYPNCFIQGQPPSSNKACLD